MSADSTIDLHGWVELGSPVPLQAAAWLRDSTITVAISGVPCAAVYPEICVEFAVRTEYEYTVNLRAVPVSARRLEVRHASPTAGLGSPAFAAQLPARF